MFWRLKLDWSEVGRGSRRRVPVFKLPRWKQLPSARNDAEWEPWDEEESLGDCESGFDDLLELKRAEAHGRHDHCFKVNDGRSIETGTRALDYRSGPSYQSRTAKPIPGKLCNGGTRPFTES